MLLTITGFVVYNATRKCKDICKDGGKENWRSTRGNYSDPFRVVVAFSDSFLGDSDEFNDMARDLSNDGLRKK